MKKTMKKVRKSKTAFGADMIMETNIGRHRGRLSRDELVDRGLIAAENSLNSHRNGKRGAPFMYKTRIKSGRHAGENITFQAWNIPHLKAITLQNHAVENEAFSIVTMARVMKSYMKSPREDY